MRIAHVVPIRRLPTERSWFDYEVPADSNVQAGDLVEIPFGQRTLHGVVWKLSDDEPTTPLKLVGRVLSSEPIMTEWQRQALEKISALYFVSLGTLAASALPTFLKRKKEDIPPLIPLATVWTTQSPRSERVWWYRDRQQAITEELTWLLKDAETRCICVPTIEDGQDFFRALGMDTAGVAFVHSQITERDYRQIYEQIRRGQIKKIIGTGRIFQLPFPSEPRWLLDQEEHPAHRQTEQHPRLDNRQTVLCLQPQAILTTPAPSLATMQTRHPNFQSFVGQRKLVALGQPGSRDWLTPDAEDLITATTSRGQSVLAIVPHHGFAQRLACRDCGWTFECPSCHQRVRLDRFQGATAACQSCGTSATVPLQCPRCQSTRWALSGLGVEQFVRTLKQRWPNIPVVASHEPIPSRAGVVVGTYQDHRLRRQQAGLEPTLIVSGDALLSYPDFAVSERAWAYLSRLQADRPDQLVMVQTYEPESLFWQRWRHGDERSWYEDELRQRKQLGLPPMAEHWMVYHPTGTARDLEQKKNELSLHLPPAVTVTILEPATKRRWRRTTGRLLIQAPAGQSLRDDLAWTKLLPSPWQIDPAIRGWSE